MKIKVISGSQTGVDQLALELARKHGLETGGTMPAGFRTNIGPRPDLAVLYGMTEHRSRNYALRTVENVQNSHLTLWFGVTSPGFTVTRRACRTYGRAFLDNRSTDEIWQYIKDLLLFWQDTHSGHDVLIINVAGNRYETHPESTEQARKELDPLFELLAMVVKEPV